MAGPLRNLQLADDECPREHLLGEAHEKVLDIIVDLAERIGGAGGMASLEDRNSGSFRDLLDHAGARRDWGPCGPGVG